MQNINSIVTDEQIYTQITAGIANMPKKLWLMGSLPTKRLPSVAIVGTRKPTPYGKEVTYQLSYALAQRGIVVISGLALGVDGIVHQAALDAGGITVAVLPTSLDRIHPKTHHDLARRIIKNRGALLSEYGPHDGIYKANFVARNRIVAALSDGVLITEATTRSGTTSTANFALEQGKTVMAVPGNITSPMSGGCNNLLKAGAAPILGVDDILHELGLSDTAQTALPLSANADEQAILQLIRQGHYDGDELQQKSGLSATLFNQTLTMLEIEGKIRALGANQWGIRK